jgi:radical SAM superfamily enzyme YgiQ (UPF0313 family)
MKVAVIYPDYYLTGCIKGQPQGRIYLGVAYLSAALRQAGHEMTLLHIVEPLEREELLQRIKDEDPQLIGFSCTTPMYAKVREMAAWVKEGTGLPTVIGGAHATLDPQGCLDDPNMDFVCIGEGEGVIVELADALERGEGMRGIASLWGKWRGETFRNPVRPLVEDLDTLPFPDRSIFDLSLMAPDQRVRITVMASRGCPYRCYYCSNHVQRSRYPNKHKYVRFRSVDNVLTEIERIARNAESIDHVRFDDDILTLKRDWFEEFVEKYPRRIGIPFLCNSRVDLLDEEKVRKLKEAGCKTICMGIESGNPWLRREVLGRKMSDEQIVEAFQLCRKYGIGTVSLNMMGFPKEDFSMVLDTIKLNARARPGLTQVTVVYPFPGTRLYEICEEEGIIPESEADTLFLRTSHLNLKGIRPDQLELVSEYLIPFAYTYNRIFSFPAPVSKAAEKLFDWFLATDKISLANKQKVSRRLLLRTPWDWYMTVTY